MSKEYTTTTATRDALNLALGAINMARNFAEQSALPVVRRMELLLVEITEIEKDVQHVERQVSAIDPRNTVPNTQGMPVHIANMLTNLHPQERIALDAAVRHGSLDPVNPNDRLACESLFRKGVFRFGSQQRFEIEPKYAPWAGKRETPHEILAGLSHHHRELVRMVSNRGGKIRVIIDSPHDHAYNELLKRGILVTDGALDQLRIADPFKDIAG